MDGNFAPDLMIQGAGNRGDMVAENIDLRKIEVVFFETTTLGGIPSRNMLGGQFETGGSICSVVNLLFA